MQHKPFKTSFSSFSTILLFVLFMLVGIVSIPLQHIQLFPSRHFGALTVECYLRGASAEVVDLEVSNPIESTLSGLKGVTNIRSVSSNGVCRINIELDKYTNQEVFRLEAAVLMRKLFDRLPAGASYPQLTVNGVSGNDKGGSMLRFGIRGPESVNATAAYVKQHIYPLLADNPGVDRIEITGNQAEEYAIQTNAGILREHGLTFEAISFALKVGLGAAYPGVYQDGNHALLVYIDRTIKEPAAMADFPVAANDGRIVRLGEIAHIERRLAPQSAYYRINGKEQISISIYPDVHANVIELAARIRAQVTQIKQRLPAGFELSLDADNTTYIKDELRKIYIRTALSVAILLMFVIVITRKLQYVLIVVASLAANTLLSFIFYYLFGIEVHLYSLAGITLSLGLVVDNAIVIVEDLRHTGRNRIFAAILASTMTAIGALSVIFFLEEQQRLLLLDFARCIIINLLVSLPVAYFFIPALLDKFPVTASKKRPQRKRIVAKIFAGYERMLGFMLRFRKSFLLLFILAFGIPVFLLPENITGDYYNKVFRERVNKYLGGSLYLFMSHAKKDNSSAADVEHPKLQITITMPKGADLRQMNNVVSGFEATIGKYGHKLKQVETNVGSATHAGITVSFRPQYEKGFPYQLKEILERRAVDEGGADIEIYGVGRGFNDAVEQDEFDATISIVGYNYQQLKTFATKIKDTLLENPRVSNVVITTKDRHAVNPVPEYYVNLTQPLQLSLHQAGRADIGRSLQGLAETSDNIGQIRDDANRSLNVWLENNAGTPPAIWSVMHSPTQINDSVMLRMEDMGDIKSMKGTDDIVRVNQSYILNIHYRFLGGVALNKMMRESIIDYYDKRLPFGYSILGRDHGTNWWRTGMKQQVWMVPLVLIIIYIICAVLLESLVQPLVVILIIPFSFIGVFLIFYLLHMGLDQGAYASLLMVSALVTNTALYILNDLNFIGKGRQSIRLYAKAIMAKAMPILVTTAAAVLSLLPFLLNGDEQGFWFTLSTGTIGGLLFSVLGSFVFLPLCMIKKYP